MRRRAVTPPSTWGKLYAGYIARLKKLRAEFCRPCFAYLAVTHDCQAFKPQPVEIPAEAAAFAAELREN